MITLLKCAEHEDLTDEERAYKRDALDSSRSVRRHTPLRALAGLGTTVAGLGATRYGLRALSKREFNKAYKSGKINSPGVAERVFQIPGRNGGPPSAALATRKGTAAAMAGIGLSMAGGLSMAKYLKRRQRGLKDEELREKHASYSRRALELRMRGKRGVLGTEIGELPGLWARGMVASMPGIVLGSPSLAQVGGLWGVSHGLGKKISRNREDQLQLDNLHELSDGEVIRLHKNMVMGGKK